MSVGSPFHPRTQPLNRKMQWREWSGYFASSVYADAHDIEYNAIREAAALIDVSPAVQVRVSRAGRARASWTGSSPGTPRSSAVGQVFYTPWCDEHGKVIDDGTVHRLDDDRVPLDRRRPAAPLAAPERAGLDVAIEEITERTAALALQGPLSRHVLEAATGESFADLRYFRRRAATIARHRGRREPDRLHGRPRLRAVGRRRAGGRAVGRADGRPAARTASGPRACSRSTSCASRPGSILLEVDYTRARHALNPEQAYSPAEIGLGRLVDLDKGDFVGQRALDRGGEGRRPGAPAGRPGARLGGHRALYAAQDLPPASRPAASRAPVPVFDRAAARSAGRRAPAGARSSRSRSRSRPCRRPTSDRQPPGGGVDRRGPSRPGGGDGRHAAVPGPAPQASLRVCGAGDAGARQARTSARSPMSLRNAASSIPVPVKVHDGASPGSTYTT